VKVVVQAENESVVINGEITVTVIDIVDDEVVLAIDAPEWMLVCEKEMSAALEVSQCLRPR
jgi:carbon storage regulator CsrA